MPQQYTASSVCVCVSECSVQVRATTFSHMTLTKFTKLTVPRPQQKQPTAVKANHRKCSVSNMMCVTKFNVLIYRLSSNRKSIKRLWSLIEYDSVWVIENTLKNNTKTTRILSVHLRFSALRTLSSLLLLFILDAIRMINVWQNNIDSDTCIITVYS